MKQLSIEEKAKAYDEAFEVAQRFYNNSVAITKKGLEDMFPELKESEDKRIRRCIKDLIKENTFSNVYGVTKEQCLAWIDKQDKLSTKEVGNYDHKKVLETLMNKQTLNKLEELGKDITKDKETATKFLKSAGIIDENGELAEPYRVCESTSNWNEEDDRMYNRIVTFIPLHLTAESYTACITWLKSLKERYFWKPTDAQIASLTIACDRNDRVRFDLTQLLRDLKKLKE